MNVEFTSVSIPLTGGAILTGLTMYEFKQQF